MALTQPDPDILRRAKHGDAAAFTAIVALYQAPLHNYIARALGGDFATAEDLCQEIFLRVQRSIAGFDGRCLFTTWLFQVAKHRIVDELRARERRGVPVEIDAVLQLVPPSPPPDAITDMDLVWRAIAALNDDLRLALLLRDVVGLSYAEIADALDTTLATVKWRIYKARETVAADLCGEGLARPVAVRAGRGRLG
jgi:RNA polymerase sigma-70 factor, ECF subfamily